MKIPKFRRDEIMWVEVYRDEVKDMLDDDPFVWYDSEHREIYPCVSILIPVDVLIDFLETKGKNFDFYLNEACTWDVDGLYEFAKAKDSIIAWDYSK